MAVKNLFASLSLLVGFAGTFCWGNYAIAVDDANSPENVESLDPSILEELSEENIESILNEPTETDPEIDTLESSDPAAQTSDVLQPTQDYNLDVITEPTDDKQTGSVNEPVESPASTSINSTTTTVVEKIPQTTKTPLSVVLPSQLIGPSRGSTMNAVRAEVGEPSEIISPVGDPPISRWVYSDYTVVFEHDRVIHVVAKRS